MTVDLDRTAATTHTRAASRRAVLAGAVGALAASVAGALGRPERAVAANGDALLLGSVNAATTTTSVSTNLGAGLKATQTATAGRGLWGLADNATGSTIGVEGYAASTTGTGVRAKATSGSGANRGLHASTPSPDGTAILAENTATTGNGDGIVATTAAQFGNAVRGTQTNAAGTGIGVAGVAQGSGATAVSAAATSASGTTYGLRATNASSSGTAVYASASAASGSTRAIRAESASPSGVGVNVVMTAATGTPHGIVVETNNPSSTGIQVSADGGGNGILIDSASGTSFAAHANMGTAVVASAVGLQATMISFAFGSGPALEAAGADGSAIVAESSSLTGGAAILAKGLEGGPGVRGESPIGAGLLGIGQQGVWGVSDAADGEGVLGESNGSAGVGVDGRALSTIGSTVGTRGRVNSPDGTAVIGHAATFSDADLPAAPKTGVYGFAAHDASSRGVYGQSTAGTGVRGAATSGSGVRGSATSGTGGRFEATTGFALRTVGRLRLERSAGVATVLAGTSSITVPAAIDLTSSSFVLATLVGNAGGTTTVRRTAVDAAANTFTITLTSNASANVKVGWLILS